MTDKQTQQDSKIAFITGVTGQDGSYLAEFLIKKGYIVHGMVRRASTFNTSRIDHLIHDKHIGKLKFYFHFGEMTSTTSLINLLGKIRPDEIYNLAAQSHVRVSFDIPEYTADCTAVGALRLLEAIRICNLEKNVKLYQASTSELYGKITTEGGKQNEETRFNPCSPYAISKMFAHYSVINYRDSYGIFAVNGILFNHESPRRGKTFVTRKISMLVAQIKLGNAECLYLGNLDAKRDWGHAKEYVEAMWMMIQLEMPQDFVIATGLTHSVRYFVEEAFRFVEMPITWSGNGINEIGITRQGKTVVRIDPVYFRPTEVSYLCGDASLAASKLNWKPTTSIRNIIEEMITEDLKILSPK